MEMEKTNGHYFFASPSHSVIWGGGGGVFSPPPLPYPYEKLEGSHFIMFFQMCGHEDGLLVWAEQNYLELVYFVTALVPSLTACFASSPGRRSRTDVWISREEIVFLLLW